jgi:hypothetical protein
MRSRKPGMPHTLEKLEVQHLPASMHSRHGFKRTRAVRTNRRGKPGLNTKRLRRYLMRLRGPGGKRPCRGVRRFPGGRRSFCEWNSEEERLSRRVGKPFRWRPKGEDFAPCFPRPSLSVQSEARAARKGTLEKSSPPRCRREPPITSIPPPLGSVHPNPARYYASGTSLWFFLQLPGHFGRDGQASEGPISG